MTAPDAALQAALLKAFDLAEHQPDVRSLLRAALAEEPPPEGGLDVERLGIAVDTHNEAQEPFGPVHCNTGDDCHRAIAATYARLARTPEPVTHGRHCPCTACSREDWTSPHLAPCGMHGPSCPPAYAPEAE
jgi:hypothetical protein